MLDSAPATSDGSQRVPEINQILSAALQTKEPGFGSTKELSHAARDISTRAGVLPLLSLPDTSGDGGWAEGALAVTKDLAKGAFAEVTEHPSHIVVSAFVGIEIGLVAPFAAPPLIASAAAVGLAYAGYEMAVHASNWIHAAKIVANEKDFTAYESAKAHAGLQGLGAGAADIAAGAAGGVAASYIVDSIGLASARAGATAFKTASTAIAGSEGAPSAVVPATISTPITGDLSWAAATSAKTDSAVSWAAATASKTESTVMAVSTDQPAVVVPATISTAATGDVSRAAALPALRPKPAARYVAREPFSLDQTTMTVSDPKSWAATVRANGKDSFGADALRFANSWATKMEERMASGRRLTKTMAKSAERSADTYGMDGIFYNIAKNSLYQCWKYGAKLEAVLNP